MRERGTTVLSCWNRLLRLLLSFLPLHVSVNLLLQYLYSSPPISFTCRDQETPFWSDNKYFRPWEPQKFSVSYSIFNYPLTMWKKNLPLRAPQKEVARCIWSAGHSSPTPDLECSGTLKAKLQIILHAHLQSSLDICFLFLSCKVSSHIFGSCSGW